ncbi:TnsA-like heteromeric transposase endonuclease subunit [Streptomyces sp. NPDC055817]
MRHTPDFFVRRADGTRLGMDVRPVERIRADDAEKFAMTEAACQSVGWSFERVGVPDVTLMANVRWLAGYRHPRFRRPDVGARLVEVFADGGSLLEDVLEAGDRIAVLPVPIGTCLGSTAARSCGPADVPS